ncbi:helix-turn-helix domain-containing protein, partial [Porphyromonas gulae]
MYKQLNRQQRYEISAFLRAGLNRSEIARQLEVSPSTISREIARNSTEKRKSYNP